MAAAGFRPTSPLCDSIFLPSFSTPTLHVLGRTDVIVVEERSKTLTDISSNGRIEWHDGGTYFTMFLLSLRVQIGLAGHFVPSKANWRNFLKAYLKDPLGDVPSPGPSPASQPASGTATPVTPAL